MKAKSNVKRIQNRSKQSKYLRAAIFAIVFAILGGLIIAYLHAAPGLCSTTNVIGTGTYQVTAPSAGQYRLWVRMQTPDATNTNNLNGVRVELAGSTNQCFNVTTTSASAVNQWQWINTDATASSNAHVTDNLSAGTYTAKILGLKAGVKVDKVLLLKVDNTCTPDNTISGTRQPGDNCTTSAPTVNLSANPVSVGNGAATTLTWSSTDAASCTASGGWTGTKATSGSQSSAALTANTTFTLSCTGAGGTGSQSIAVTVTSTPPTDTTPPTVTFTIPGVTVPAGQTSVVVKEQKGVSWRPTATDASGIRSTVLTVNGQTVTGTQIPVGVDVNGDYEVKAVVTDNASQVATQILTIRVRHPDFNRSGSVNILDVSGLLSRWGMTSPIYDISANGTVDILDLSYVLNRWNATD